MSPLTDPYTGMYPPNELGNEQTIQALREDAMAELDAINLYQAHLNVIKDPDARRVLEHIRDGEKEHFAEFVAALERLDPAQADYVRRLQEQGDILLPEVVGDFEAQLAEFDHELEHPFEAHRVYAQEEEEEPMFPIPRLTPEEIREVNEKLRKNYQIGLDELLGRKPLTPSAHRVYPEVESQPITPEPAPDQAVLNVYDGIVVDPGLARATKCTRLDLGPGRKPLVFSPGIVGALDHSQQALYCQEGFEEREATPEMLTHLQHTSDAAKLCELEVAHITGGSERYEAFHGCMARELSKKGGQ